MVLSVEIRLRFSSARVLLALIEIRFACAYLLGHQSYHQHASPRAAQWPWDFGQQFARYITPTKATWAAHIVSTDIAAVKVSRSEPRR